MYGDFPESSVLYYAKARAVTLASRNQRAF